MNDLLSRLAADLGVTPLTTAEEDLLLECARDVAHTSTRRHAPLTAFLLGAAVTADATERAERLATAISRVRSALREDPPAH